MRGSFLQFFGKNLQKSSLMHFAFCIMQFAFLDGCFVNLSLFFSGGLRLVTFKKPKVNHIKTLGRGMAFPRGVFGHFSCFLLQFKYTSKPSLNHRNFTLFYAFPQWTQQDTSGHQKQAKGYEKVTSNFDEKFLNDRTGSVLSLSSAKILSNFIQTFKTSSWIRRPKSSRGAHASN